MKKASWNTEKRSRQLVSFNFFFLFLMSLGSLKIKVLFFGSFFHPIWFAGFFLFFYFWSFYVPKKVCLVTYSIFLIFFVFYTVLILWIIHQTSWLEPTYMGSWFEGVRQLSSHEVLLLDTYQQHMERLPEDCKEQLTRQLVRAKINFLSVEELEQWICFQKKVWTFLQLRKWSTRILCSGDWENRNKLALRLVLRIKKRLKFEHVKGLFVKKLGEMVEGFGMIFQEFTYNIYVFGFAWFVVLVWGEFYFALRRAMPYIRDLIYVRFFREKQPWELPVEAPEPLKLHWVYCEEDDMFHCPELIQTKENYELKMASGGWKRRPGPRLDLDDLLRENELARQPKEMDDKEWLELLEDLPDDLFL